MKVSWFRKKKNPKEEPFQRHEGDQRQADPEGQRRKFRWSKNSKQDHPRDPDGGSAYNEKSH